MATTPSHLCSLCARIFADETVSQLQDPRALVSVSGVHHDDWTGFSDAVVERCYVCTVVRDAVAPEEGEGTAERFGGMKWCLRRYDIPNCYPKFSLEYLSIEVRWWGNKGERTDVVEFGFKDLDHSGLLYEDLSLVRANESCSRSAYC
jgi:hypothetical protein